jgi:hypothetical protein
MAHFAELDSSNVVTRVIVISNEELLDDNNVEQESKGIAFCQSLFGGTWVQTSFNGNMRKNYAGVGFKYDESRDAFIPPQPFPSWVLNEETCLYEPPIAKPDDGSLYSWDEDMLSWVEATL